MNAYYNENDPKIAAWLRELIKQGHIAKGVVDERSIEDVKPSELTGFTQCHFFAGIGVWSYALRQAGWLDNKPVWTGSCPCQPFSAAGKGAGFADERHLWPAWFHLIQHGKPASVPIFGEQVASKDGLAWLALVQADLEAAGYAVRPVDLCAAGVGSPNIRQRLFFDACRVAYSDNTRSQGRVSGWANAQWENQHGQLGRDSATSRMADTTSNARGERLELESNRWQENTEQDRVGCVDDRPRATRQTNGFWRDADWLGCRDGKWRPVEPGTFPLVDGVAARVGRLRGYGNAINAEVARVFIESTQEG